LIYTINCYSLLPIFNY